MEKNSFQKPNLPRKTIKDLPLSDNFMFGAVMSDEEMCKLFLEAVLHKKIARIEFVGNEHTISNFPGLHGIRMDIYVEDGEGTRYNVEMEKNNKTGDPLEKRARFYQGKIDHNFLKSGAHYHELPHSYIIYVCDYDYFGRGYTCYERVSIIKDCPDLEYEDGSHVMIFNTHYKVANVDHEVQEFLDYVRTNDDTTEFEGRLANKARELVHTVRNDAEMEEKYMTLQMYMDDKLREGIAIGKQEGRQEGIEEMLHKSILAIADILSIEEIANRFKLSVPAVQDILNSAQNSTQL